MDKIEDLEKEINILRLEQKQTTLYVNNEKRAMINALLSGGGEQMRKSIIKRNNLTTLQIKWLNFKQFIINLYYKITKKGL